MKGFELHTLTDADVVVAMICNGHLRVYSSTKDLEAAEDERFTYDHPRPAARPAQAPHYPRYPRPVASQAQAAHYPRPVASQAQAPITLVTQDLLLDKRRPPLTPDPLLVKRGHPPTLNPRLKRGHQSRRSCNACE